MAVLFSGFDKKYGENTKVIPYITKDTKSKYLQLLGGERLACPHLPYNGCDVYQLMSFNA